MTSSRRPLRTLALRISAITAAFALVLAAAPCVHAEQRGTDIIIGMTADERGTAAADRPDISAKNAIVMGQDGTVYFERDADAPVKIASITKVMTAIVALENAQLSDTVTVDNAAATVGESSAGLKEGDTLTLGDALHGLLSSSGNDAALAIATTVGKKLDPASSDPVQTFVATMNAKAKEIGCKDSVYENPHGLDFGAWMGNMHGTARDVAITFAYAMKIDAFKLAIASQGTPITVTGADGAQRSLPQSSHNELLGKDGNIGGKTGTTDEAGYCFVGAYTRDTGGEIYTVELNAPDDDQRFADTATLANWYYSHVAMIPLADATTKMGDTPIVGRAALSDWSDKTVTVTLADPQQTVTAFSLGGDIEPDVQFDALSGDVEQGKAAGTVSYMQNGKQIGEAKLVTAEAKSAPSPLEWAMVQFDRFVRMVQGKPGTAETKVMTSTINPLDYDATA